MSSSSSAFLDISEIRKPTPIKWVALEAIAKPTDENIAKLAERMLDVDGDQVSTEELEFASLVLENARNLECHRGAFISALTSGYQFKPYPHGICEVGKVLFDAGRDLVGVRWNIR